MTTQEASPDGQRARPRRHAPEQSLPAEFSAALRTSAYLASAAPPGVRAAPQVEALAHSHGPMTGGIYRVAAAAQPDGPDTPWSVILKILRPAAVPPGDQDDPASWCYWRREVLAYQCGVL